MKRVVTIIILFSSFLLAQIQNPADPISSGPYPVASTNLEHDDAKVAAAVTAGNSVGNYWEGRYEEKKYVSDLLSDNSSIISFDLEIPNDSDLYGEEAGKTYKYVALIFYPTKSDNSRENYTLPGDFVLQKMQKNSESPIFPDTPDKLKLLIYSHGKGDHPVAHIPNMEFLASHGYVTAALFFADKRYLEFGAGDATQSQDLATRPLAVSKLIDYLAAHNDFKDKIDFENIAAAGLSYGGTTNLGLFGGEILGLPPTFLPNRPLVTDDRIKCAVGIVPYVGTDSKAQPPVLLFGVNASGLANVSKPYLAIAAENDEIVPYDFLKDVMQNKMQGDKYLVKIDSLGHYLSAEANQDILSWTIMFLNKYLSDDPQAFETATSISGAESDNFIPLFLPEAPQLSEPVDNFEVTGTDVSLNWSFKNDASSYKIEISGKNDFSSKVADATLILNPEYSFDSVQNDTEYYWRVKAVNDIGESTYSETRRFYKGNITSVQDQVPLEFSLSQNYPNPFNPETTIDFSVPEESNVCIKIYNILGQNIETIVNKTYPAGNYKVKLTAENFSSGVYYYTMKSGSYFKVRRMVIVK